ncbi:ECF transporter S component [Halorubrum sp. CBA1125]|jgi:energy-coupling factor transport system substrate-specific component|uniref:ECF transporter S component n=1 Tax=Halorubrum sp. CBA1125 TaxID=2668072 RepID=UPI0012E7E014|nr:ECF transporter S component [Halorubrum sp. CBA1125]MUW13450.1 ECF transporter S component [Halorubrum sp. CBA1125]
MSSETVTEQTANVETSFIGSISDEFTTFAWVLIPVAVGLNLTGGFLVRMLRIPLFMDTIGTVLLAIIAGPFAAALAGIVTNLVLGAIQSPTSIPFAITQVAIAFAAGYLAYRGWFRILNRKDYLKLIGAGIVIAAVSTIVSTPIVVLVFGGVTGSATSALTGFFLATGAGIVEAVLSQQIITSPTDKIATVIISVYLARQIPTRYLTSKGHRALYEE